MLVCGLTKIDSKKRLICSITGTPCMFQRYCDIKMKWLQTDGAAKCKVRAEHGKRNDATDS